MPVSSALRRSGGPVREEAREPDRSSIGKRRRGSRPLGRRAGAARGETTRRYCSAATVVRRAVNCLKRLGAFAVGRMRPTRLLRKQREPTPRRRSALGLPAPLHAAAAHERNSNHGPGYAPLVHRTRPKTWLPPRRLSTTVVRKPVTVAAAASSSADVTIKSRLPGNRLAKRQEDRSSPR
jgi:hypothetical protein